MASKLFKDYYSKIAKEGFIKALMWGAIVGFSSMLVTSALLWFFNPDLFWLAFIAFGVVTAATTAVLYLVKFRPTTKQIAQRVDLLGLEERILTMTELEGDTSFIAMKQREDALSALKTVTAKNLKLAFSVPVIVSLSIVAVFAAGMTTVTGLTSAGVVPNPDDIFEGPETPPEEYEVVYEIQGDGEIFGEILQVITSGEDATAVYAEPLDGWAFVEWNDGVNQLGTDPYRQDFKITKNMTIYAVFAEAEESDGDGDGEGEGEGEGQPKPSDKPGDGEGQGEGDGDGPPSDSPGEGAGGNKGGENNVVIDGNTDLGDVVGDASTEATEGANQNSDISDTESNIVGDYMGGIGGGAGSGSGEGSGNGSN